MIIAHSLGVFPRNTASSGAKKSNQKYPTIAAKATAKIRTPSDLSLNGFPPRTKAKRLHHLKLSSLISTLHRKRLKNKPVLLVATEVFWEQKMYTGKISKALASALSYLEDAIDSQAEPEVPMLVWKAATDLEYGLFLFSLKDPENTNSAWKLPSSKQTEIKSLLVSTRKLLQEASESLTADSLKEPHKKTWLARGQLLEIHDFYEKNRPK